MVANHSRQIALFGVAECWRCSTYLTTMECLVIKLVTNTNHALVTNATTGNRKGFGRLYDNYSVRYQRIGELISRLYIFTFKTKIVNFYEVCFHRY